MRAPTREEMLQKIAEVEAEMPAILADAQRLERAMQEPSFSGYLRRELHPVKKTTPVILRETGLSKLELINFLEGSGVLTSEQIDRLVVCLDIQMAPMNR